MRVMILGGGSSQIGAFRRARELGITTILADRDPAAPARPLADEFAPASTFDVDAVTDAARDYRVDAILALGTDQPVYTAAVASARLALPYPLSPEGALGVTNKRVMKRRFDEAGIPTPRWCLIGPDRGGWHDLGFDRLRPPYVVKPVDSQGQRGIIRAETPDEVAAHYPVARAFSREETVLVEEFFPSLEVTVSGWAHAPDDVEIWTVTDRVTIDNPPGLGVCLAHRYPSYHAGTRIVEIRSLTRRIVAAFGLSGGPIYFQMLVGNETVRVNEIAFRLGGAYEDLSIPPVTGVDILSRQLTAIRRAGELAGGVAGGETSRVPESTQGPSAPAEEPQFGYFAVPLIFARPGTVTELSGAEELRGVPGVSGVPGVPGVPGVTDCRFLLPPGTVIRPMENSTQRIACAVLHGATRAEINTLVDTVFDTLRIGGSAGEELLLDTREAVKHPTARS